MEKTRTALVDAYVRLGCAQADYILNQNKTASNKTESPTASPTSTVPPSVTSSDVEQTVSEVQKYIDLTDQKVLYC